VNQAASKEQVLRDLHARLRKCRLCLEAGYEIYPRAIFSGNSDARIMSIGQAPGITEKEAGRPFNAGSGTRLFQWLAEAGIEENWYRQTQYMSSVTKCYPGRANSGSGDRVPTRAEQQLCHPYLEGEIALVDPQLVLLIGRLAINLYFPANLPLAKLIGSHKQVDGRWLVPLPHPSGASRWHQIAENRVLLDRAIGLIREHVKQIYPDL